ncbi:MAG TPA: hypothetical protein VHE61_21785 [Opitutaceae bacterium]|nr:hypothetical protein [Opitutaceae bacterium]
MKNKLLPVLIAATLLACGARAQNESAPTATAPAGGSQPAVTTPAAPVVTQAAPAPNQVIYAPRLPTPAELTNVARAQGMSIEQISQTATQVTAIYRNAGGEITTVAYQLLPTAATATTTTVVVPSPAPTVIYDSRPRVVYYDRYDPWYPNYWYPPVSLSFGFGYYHGGWGHGGWGHGDWGRGRGGYHHGR